MFLYFLCCLITVSSVMVQAFVYKSFGPSADYRQIAKDSMNVIKMSEIQPVIDDLSARERGVESSAAPIIEANEKLGPGAAKKPVPKSPYTGLYMFNTCVQFNLKETKAAHTAAGKKTPLHLQALKLAHFDAFKVEKGDFLKIGWVLFNLDTFEGGEGTDSPAMAVLAGTVGGSQLSNEASVAQASGVEGSMIMRAFDYRQSKGPPHQLWSSIRDGVKQVIVLIIVGPKNRAKWKEPNLVQFRTSPLSDDKTCMLGGFGGVIYGVEPTGSGKARIAPYNKQGREEYAGFAAQENYFDFANEYEDYQYLHSAPIVSKNDPFWALMILDVLTIFVVVICMSVFLCAFVGYYHYNKSQQKESLTYAPQQQV